MTPVRFPGEDVTIGGTPFTVPPLGFFALKTLLPTIERISVGDDGAAADPLGQLDDITTLCLAALTRNYPDYTRDALIADLHFPEFAPLVAAVMRQSGLAGVKEKNGAAVASLSSGPRSTADSLPPSAGAGSTSTNA